MARKERNNQINRNRIGMIGICIVLVLLIFILPVFCQGAVGNLEKLEKMLDQSRYSGFQKRMICDSAEQLLGLGTVAEEIEKIITISIDNNFDAYNVKKIFEVLIEAKENDLSEKSLVNKIKEGSAKRVDDRLIINALENEVNHLKVAKKLVINQQFADASSKDKMVEVIVESLNNGVPPETLTEVIAKSIEQGKTPEEISDISTELGNLSLRASELGFSEDDVLNVFQKAVQDRTEVEGICEDIQDILIGAAAAKMKMSSGKSASGTGESASISDIAATDDTDTASGTTGIIPSPDDSTGSAPTDADDKPETDSEPDDDGNSSPPEN